MKTENIAIEGIENRQKSLVASISNRLSDMRKVQIRESMLNFQNSSHRLEFVSSIRGIDFINDSKSTNINSTWFSFESINKPIIWLVGGSSCKNNKWEELKELVSQKVKKIICIGNENNEIINAFSSIINDIEVINEMQIAVSESYYSASKGDVILLSPACLSFDNYTSFEDRGEQFIRAIKEL